jgi:hypothetical protein
VANFIRQAVGDRWPQAMLANLGADAHEVLERLDIREVRKRHLTTPLIPVG